MKQRAVELYNLSLAFTHSPHSHQIEWILKFSRPHDAIVL